VVEAEPLGAGIESFLSVRFAVEPLAPELSQLPLQALVERLALFLQLFVLGFVTLGTLYHDPALLDPAILTCCLGQTVALKSTLGESFLRDLLQKRLGLLDGLRHPASQRRCFKESSSSAP
jgi:hypothetical protein